MVEPQYEGRRRILLRVWLWSESAANWGLIDKRGQELVAPAYEYRPPALKEEPFSDGLAVVKQGRYCGFIDKFGREVIALRYLDANDFSEGLAGVFIAGGLGIY